MLFKHILTVAVPAVFVTALLSQFACADTSLDNAVESVTTAELYEHVATLADDAFEGRSVGSRGGYAAARYIVKQLDEDHVTPAGADNTYFQPCEREGRNILAVHPGTDPQLAQEYIVVGAHYDHVGDGTQGHALGPAGKIYNGADDNASGVAVVLEIAQALAAAHVDTRRSILFAFWDGEEQNLVGSKHWFASPTIPTSAVRLDITLDMVGRLRDGKLQILGTRTGYGLRRLFSGYVHDPLWLDFSWELKANSDHWPFVQNEVPCIMLHTGLHDDYHRPTDDVEKINAPGMEQIARYLAATVIEVANANSLPTFRADYNDDTLAAQRSDEKRDAALAAQSRWPGASPPRLGITWRTDDAEPGSIWITHVAADSPAAAAGLRPNDRIDALNGEAFPDDTTFRERITSLLDTNAAEFTLLLESRGQFRTVTVHWRPATLAAKSST